MATPIYIFSLAIMTFKETIYNYYLQLITLKIIEVEKNIADIKDSAANETKSTAGDKHETALAMLQIEEVNKREQLKVIQQQKQVLQHINPLLVNSTINKGSLVKTSKGYFFISVALGKAIIENEVVIAISSQSPLGICLIGLKQGEHMVFNNVQYVVEFIL